MENWAIWHNSEFDWKAGDVFDITSLDIPNLSLPKQVINQNYESWTSLSCTITRAYLQRCQVMGVDPSITTWTDCLKFAKKEGRDWKGQYSYQWVDQVRKRGNTQWLWQVMSLNIKYDSVEYDYLTKRWFLIGATYRGNSDYVLDYARDWVLNWVEFPNPTYWHAINVFVLWDEKAYNSYAGTTYNVYQIEHLKELIENKVYYPTFYVFLKEERVNKKIDDVKKEQQEKDLERLGAMASEITIMIEKNSKVWKLTNDEDYRALLHKMNEANRKKLKDIEIELNKINDL